MSRRDDELVAIWEFFDLVASSARSGRQRDRVLRAAGVAIPPASLGLLRLVHRHGPLPVGELARRAHVDQSTASRQLRPLEDHGLVARSADPADGRVARVGVTPAGVEVLDRTRAVVLHDIDVALADWDGAERRRLVELLGRFRQGLLDARPDETGWAYRPGTVDRRSSA